MGTFSKEKRMLESKGALPLLSTATLLPLLLATIFMGPFLFSYVCMGGLLVFLFSFLWGFWGFRLSAMVFIITLVLGGDFSLLKKIQPVFFLLISMVSSYAVVLLEEHREEERAITYKGKEDKILELTKALEQSKKESFFAGQDLASLEKEIFLREIEEDPSQTHLIHLLKQEQVYVQDLEQEIRVLETMITKMSYSLPQQRSRVKKIKQERGEWFLPIEFPD